MLLGLRFGGLRFGLCTGSGFVGGSALAWGFVGAGWAFAFAVLFAFATAFPPAFPDDFRTGFGALGWESVGLRALPVLLPHPLPQPLPPVALIAFSCLWALRIYAKEWCAKTSCTTEILSVKHMWNP